MRKLLIVVIMILTCLLTGCSGKTINIEESLDTISNINSSLFERNIETPKKYYYESIVNYTYKSNYIEKNKILIDYENNNFSIEYYYCLRDNDNNVKEETHIKRCYIIEGDNLITAVDVNDTKTYTKWSGNKEYWLSYVENEITDYDIINISKKYNNKIWNICEIFKNETVLKNKTPSTVSLVYKLLNKSKNDNSIKSTLKLDILHKGADENIKADLEIKINIKNSILKEYNYKVIGEDKGNNKLYKINIEKSAKIDTSLSYKKINLNDFDYIPE